jgi:hypothetical protein
MPKTQNQAIESIGALVRGNQGRSCVLWIVTDSSVVHIQTLLITLIRWRVGLVYVSTGIWELNTEPVKKEPVVYWASNRGATDIQNMPLNPQDKPYRPTRNRTSAVGRVRVS